VTVNESKFAEFKRAPYDETLNQQQPIYISSIHHKYIKGHLL